MMIQNLILEENETLCWEGRPAPRCYTFRHWRHSIFGTLFFLICSYWQVLGFSMAAEYKIPWLIWLPLPFVLLGFYYSVGHLIQARFEWNRVCYAITNHRLVTQRGLFNLSTDSLALKDLTYLTMHKQGDQLGTLRVYKAKEKQLVLHCLEHPQQALKYLEAAIKENMNRLEAPSSSGLVSTAVNEESS